MSAFDALDVVSFLLGAAASFLAVESGPLRGHKLPLFSRGLMMIGLTLILAYAFSEVLHAVQAARR